MDRRSWFLLCAALLGGTSVALGAFAAHGLKTRISDDLLVVFETGVRYQMYHALALLAVCALGSTLWVSPWMARAGWAWIIGIIFFSGSLYILAITGIRWLGAITPLGGVAFLVGWGCLAIAAWQWKN